MKKPDQPRAGKGGKPSSLSAEEIGAARAFRAEGWSYQQIAEKLTVSYWPVYYLFKKKKKKNAPAPGTSLGASPIAD